MTWIRLTDTVAERPEWEDLGTDAFTLHVAAIGYSNRQQTGGRIKRSVVRRLLWIDHALDVAESLVKAGAWDHEDREFLIVWDLAEQLTPDEVERHRALQAERQKRSRMHKRGDHSLCNPDYCRGASRDASRDESRYSARVPNPSQPDPTQPDPPGSGLGWEGGEGRAPGSAGPDASQERKRCAHGAPIAADGSGCEQCEDLTSTASLRIIEGGVA